MRFHQFLIFFCIIGFSYSLQAQENPAGKRRVSRVKKPAKVSQYKMEQFDGRWQENNRINSKTKEAVAYSDTIYIRFYDSTKADTKEGNSVVITGSASIDRNDDITTSARDFHIVSVAENEIVLDDMDGFVHSFIRKDVFNYELATPSAAGVLDQEKVVIEISSANLLKNWFVYRRGANPGFIKPETPVIKNLLIKEKTAENLYKGDIEFSIRGLAETKPCTLTFTGNNLTISSQSNTWIGEVYQLDEKQLVFGKKGELVYYFRPL